MRLSALVAGCLTLCSCSHFPTGRLGGPEEPPGAARERAFEAGSSSRQFRHPELGVLISDNTLWMGGVERAGQRIPFMLVGTREAPDARLLKGVSGIVGRFASVRRQALDYLLKQEPDARKVRLEFEMLVASDREHPANFVLDFSVNGDADSLWRVTFEDARPVKAEYDD